MLSAGSCGECNRRLYKHGFPSNDGKYILCAGCWFPRKPKRRSKKK